MDNIEQLELVEELVELHITDPELKYHSQRVALAFRLGSVDYLVALLHDSVEDSCVHPDALRVYLLQNGLEAVWRNVETLTRVEGEKYFDYIQRVKESDRVAIRVKLSDLFDNMYGRPSKPNGSLMKRYKKAMKILLDE